MIRLARNYIASFLTPRSYRQVCGLARDSPCSPSMHQALALEMCLKSNIVLPVLQQDNPTDAWMTHRVPIGTLQSRNYPRTRHRHYLNVKKAVRLIWTKNFWRNKHLHQTLPSLGVYLARTRVKLTPKMRTTRIYHLIRSTGNHQCRKAQIKLLVLR